MKRQEHRRHHSLAPLLMGALALVPAAATAQRQQQFRETTVVKIEAGAWTGPRLPDGQPDVEGHWSNTIGNHNNLTNPQGGGGAAADAANVRPAASATLLMDRCRSSRGRVPSRKSSGITSKIPSSPNTSSRWRGVRQVVRRSPSCGTATRSDSIPDMCLFLFDSGTRVIHLDGKPHLPDSIKLWNADSRGRWEGNTLVVDVTNNNSKARFARTGEFASDNATVAERYIFDNGGERFTYEAVYTDPTVFTRPWTITIPNRRVTDKTPQDDWNNLTFLARHPGTDPIIEAYERICVEGNADHGQVAVESK